MSNLHVFSWPVYEGFKVKDEDDETDFFESTKTECQPNVRIQAIDSGPYLSNSPASSSGNLITPPSTRSNSKSDDCGQQDLFTTGKRLWQEIHYSSQWGLLPDCLGMTRLTLTDEDKDVRDYFVSEASNLGCEIRIDEIGNIFAILPGENNDLPPIGMGSHLDTQPSGGRFDGILGVLGALEVLKSIRSSGKKTYAPVAAINWTNEEGARFTPGCTGSAVWASHSSLAKAYSLCDSSDFTVWGELQRIGYCGNVPASYRSNPLSAHFELHIEQHTRLQDAHRKIGIVTGIQGIRWYEAHIFGERAHAGSVMCDRSDTLTCSAKIVVFIEEKAVEFGAVATVGVVELENPAPNTVPGSTVFTLDIRHPSENTLDLFQQSVYDFMATLEAEDNKITCEIVRSWRSPAAVFDEEAMSCTREAASSIVGEEMSMDLLSFAGHDSALIALRIPTSMIFVPSKDGISHAPEEYTTEEECATGLQVLRGAVLNYDDKLRKRHEESPGYKHLTRKSASIESLRS